jgi:hypothetical protein
MGFGLNSNADMDAQMVATYGQATVEISRFCGNISEACLIVAMILGGCNGAPNNGGDAPTSGPRGRHHTSPGGMAGIEADGAINAGRSGGAVPVDGVHVETQPFGPLRGAYAETGAAGSGAYVEIDVPPGAIPTNIGPRNTAVIPTDTALPIGNLNPNFVSVRAWWNLWGLW